MEQNTNEIISAWKQAVDPELIKAAAENWDEYSPSVQRLIEAEARRRGLWEKVLYLRGEKPEYPISSEGHLEGYVCESCKRTQPNPNTGRCYCDFPIEDFGYCKTCDKFFSIPPGRLCPQDNTKLIKRKASTDLVRLGNYFFDIIILRILAFPVFFIVAIALFKFGFLNPDSLNEIDPSTEFILGLSYVFLYYFIFESLCQRTPGKLITGTKVIDIDGRKPTLGAIAIRTLIRFIPFEAFSFPGKKAYGWHDRWSETYVVKAKRFGGKKFRTDIPAITTDNLEKETVINENLSEQISTQINQKFHEDGLTTPVPIEESVDKEQDNIKQATDKNDETETFSEGVKSDQELDTQAILLGRLEKCANCDRIIGKFEHSYKFKGNIVCVQCHEQLMKEVHGI